MTENVTNKNEMNVTTTTNVEKVNKVSAKKAQAQAKANGMLLDSILNKFAQGTTLLKGTKGQSVDIYKKEIFADMFADQKKAARKKLRNVRDGWAKEILSAKDKMLLQKICKQFYDYYCAVYTVNDLSVNSICSARTDEQTRKLLEKALNIVKATLKK